MAAKGSRGTIRDFPGFNADADAQILRKAMKGFGTDEKSIIDVLTRRSFAQRQKIIEAFKTAFGRDLVADVKSEVSGTLELVLVALLTAPDKYDAAEMRFALKGAGTDEDILIEVLASRTNRQLQALVRAYKHDYDSSLEDDICSDTDHYFQRMLVALLQGNRDDDGPVDAELVKKDAQVLLEAGEKSWGTDEEKFITVMCLRSFTHLRRVVDEYKSLSKKTLEESIQSEMSGSLERLMMAVVTCAVSTPTYFAERLYKAMKGAGTDERTLLRVLVSRSEIDLGDIQEVFANKYGGPLATSIQGEVGGDFRETLLKLCSP
uniref:Annexin n=1 Tax=Petromyzon marinus TaxID=7757 RepID=A0AAJ7SK52_PETMA|nr:annexin A5-like [Petromyzon marinus]XP_032800924.1 annexin A5-like [Petromyzon marinus]XP_032800925.1 annexin A5-like [Petromyzon marinus]XP_032800926.1 annexin A5-like [Petromyzon marinus]